jgi:site-specific DNA recombinase
MIKVALYARVSSERQAEKDLSIPAQLKALKNHALKHGWEPVKEFVDEAESARSANRPAFQEMIAYTKQKPLPFSIILVWKLSRFARNREDSILYKALLRKRGVQVVSMNEQIDETPTGRLLEGMIESIDEFYSANLGQDTRRGMKENAQRGYLNGAPVAYGYQATFKQINGAKRRVLELNENEAPVVKRAFDLFFEGEGAKNIAQRLNGDGFRTRHGKPWGKHVILYMLKNETYTGTFIWNRFNKSNGGKVLNPESEQIRLPNHHTALIEQSRFDKIQRLLAERAPEQRTHPRVVASTHLLSGLVFCAHCGAKMIVSTAKSGQFVYYACQRKFKEGKASCSQKSLNAEKLEPCIIGVIKDRLLTEANLSKIINMVLEELQSEEHGAGDKLAVFKSQLEETERKLRRYYELIETGGVLMPDIASRLRELNSSKDALLAEQAKCEAFARRAAPAMPSFEVVKGYVNDLRETLQEGSIMQQKAFLRSFIRRIGIKGDQAEIEYTCPIGLSGNRKQEVLSLDRNGSKGRTRTVIPNQNTNKIAKTPVLSRENRYNSPLFFTNGINFH